MSPEPARTAKAVHLIPRDSEIKRVCFDDATQSLRPNLVMVDRQGAVVFEINELGLKGAARDPARRLAVVWGDSVVFGVRWGWPRMLDELAPGYQFLNGGIEADPYDNILRRAAAFNRVHEVALNIVMLGWHPLDAAMLAGTQPARRRAFGALLRPFQTRTTIAEAARPAPGNNKLRADLLRFIEDVRNAVLATMPTALNRAIANQDLSPYFRAGGRDEVFQFGGDLPYSLDVQRYMFEHITERNAIVREVAQATGTRLIDLAAAFDTAERADFRDDFFDVLHLRPRAYAKAAAIVHSAIKDLLQTIG